MTSAAVREPDVGAVLDYLGRRTGLAFAPQRRGQAAAAIRKAMAKAELEEPSELLGLLAEERLSLDDLIAELTISETYFFREPAQFDFIRGPVLAELARTRGPGHLFRLWSAGCATGEEAYSLAILCEEEGIAAGTTILATDLSRVALKGACAASYGRWSLRRTEPPFIARYFHRQGERFRLADRFHRRVQFEYLNLVEDAYPSLASGTWGMDVILCRNVLIYFDQATVDRVTRRLLASLSPGGWLFTGPSDPTIAVEPPFECVATPAGLAYRRAASGLAPVTRPEGFAETAPAIAPEAEAEAEAEAPAPPVRAGLGADPPRPRPRPGESDFLARPRQASVRRDHEGVLALTSPSDPDADAFVLRIRALANLADLGEAERTAASATRSHPSCAELQFLHAITLMGLGRDDEAQQALRRVLYLDRSLAIAHLALGTLLWRRGDLGGAGRAYRRGHACAAGRPPDELVPLGDGERAARIAEAARAQMALIEGLAEPRQ